MKMLLLVEHDGKFVTPGSLNAINAFSGLEGSLDLLVTSEVVADIVDQLAKLGKADRILYSDGAQLDSLSAMEMSELIESLAQGYDCVAGPSSRLGNAALARVAAAFDVPLINNVVELIDENTFVRPVHGGRLQQTIGYLATFKVLTLMPTVCGAATNTRAQANRNSTVEELIFCIESKRSAARVIAVKPNHTSRPELKSAKLVVGAGRGLETRDNFARVEILADQLGAALGATRAVVDLEWMHHHYQIGQTATRIAPEIYLALGVSGAIQHLAGIQGSRIIIAVNKDSEAPIMKHADYVMIGDLNELLPEILQRLETWNGHDVPHSSPAFFKTVVA